MLVNPWVIEKKFKCNKILANYLMNELHFPPLGIEGKCYYFTDNELLQEALERLPLWLKILRVL
jgi:hypothetical protein